MENKKAFILLQKFLDGKASFEEKALIDKWYVAQDQAESIKIEGDPELVKAELYQKILTELNGESKERKAIVVPLYKKMIFKVAAAVIFVSLSVGALFFINNKQSRELAVVEKNQSLQKDIVPGGNKAVLTLADGSTIILDSAQNGLLSQQGNIKIIKLQNGKVAYESRENDGVGAITKVAYNTITTPRGGQYQLELSDGSLVWLNAASSITFPTSFTGNLREVRITGEAYFEVAHTANMPFRVNVNGMEVQVLGTNFNINAYEEEGVLKTTLLEGSVRVTKGAESKLIVPGEQVSIENNNDLITVNKEVDLVAVVAWKNGYFSFDKADIKTVLNQLSRWYDVDVIYQGDVPSQLFWGEMQRSLSLSQVLKGLEKTGIHFRIENRNIIVMP